MADNREVFNHDQIMPSSVRNYAQNAGQLAAMYKAFEHAKSNFENSPDGQSTLTPEQKKEVQGEYLKVTSDVRQDYQSKVAKDSSVADYYNTGKYGTFRKTPPQSSQLSVDALRFKPNAQDFETIQKVAKEIQSQYVEDVKLSNQQTGGSPDLTPKQKKEATKVYYDQVQSQLDKHESKMRQSRKFEEEHGVSSLKFGESPGVSSANTFSYQGSDAVANIGDPSAQMPDGRSDNLYPRFEAPSFGGGGGGPVQSGPSGGFMSSPLTPFQPTSANIKIIDQNGKVTSGSINNPEVAKSMANPAVQNALAIAAQAQHLPSGTHTINGAKCTVYRVPEFPSAYAPQQLTGPMGFPPMPGYPFSPGYPSPYPQDRPWDGVTKTHERIAGQTPPSAQLGVDLSAAEAGLARIKDLRAQIQAEIAGLKQDMAELESLRVSGATVSTQDNPKVENTNMDSLSDLEQGAGRDPADDYEVGSGEPDDFEDIEVDSGSDISIDRGYDQFENLETEEVDLEGTGRTNPKIDSRSEIDSNDGGSSLGDDDEIEIDDTGAGEEEEVEKEEEEVEEVDLEGTGRTNPKIDSRSEIDSNDGGSSLGDDDEIEIDDTGAGEEEEVEKEEEEVEEIDLEGTGQPDPKIDSRSEIDSNDKGSSLGDDDEIEIDDTGAGEEKKEEEAEKEEEELEEIDLEETGQPDPKIDSRSEIDSNDKGSSLGGDDEIEIDDTGAGEENGEEEKEKEVEKEEAEKDEQEIYGAGENTGENEDGEGGEEEKEKEVEKEEAEKGGTGTDGTGENTGGNEDGEGGEEEKEKEVEKEEAEKDEQEIYGEEASKSEEKSRDGGKEQEGGGKSQNAPQPLPGGGLAREQSMEVIAAHAQTEARRQATHNRDALRQQRNFEQKLRARTGLRRGERATGEKTTSEQVIEARKSAVQEAAQKTTTEQEGPSHSRSTMSSSYRAGQTPPERPRSTGSVRPQSPDERPKSPKRPQSAEQAPQAGSAALKPPKLNLDELNSLRDRTHYSDTTPSDGARQKPEVRSPGPSPRPSLRVPGPAPTPSPRGPKSRTSPGKVPGYAQATTSSTAHKQDNNKKPEVEKKAPQPKTPAKPKEPVQPRGPTTPQKDASYMKPTAASKTREQEAIQKKRETEKKAAAKPKVTTPQKDASYMKPTAASKTREQENAKKKEPEKAPQPKPPSRPREKGAYMQPTASSMAKTGKTEATSVAKLYNNDKECKEAISNLKNSLREARSTPSTGAETVQQSKVKSGVISV